MEGQRLDHHHYHQRPNHQDHHHHQNPNFYQHHPLNRHAPYSDQNQNYDHQFNHYNNDYHSNYDANLPSNGEPNESFNAAGGGFRFNGRKRGRYHSARGVSPDHNDGCGNPKLYVATVPRTITEQDVRPLFEEHGNVVEVILPWDKWSGQQHGYCFVKYATLDDADLAIGALNNQYTFPGEAAPIKVRYADGERERLGKGEREQQGKFLFNNSSQAFSQYKGSEQGGFVDKLYVGCINKQASKQEIEEIFSPYGYIEDVYIARDEMKQSRGCAFIKFSHRDMALAAIRALNGTFTMRGCEQPLIVRFADPKKPRGNYAFSGPAFGSCGRESMIRPPSSSCDSVGVYTSSNASYPMQEVSSNSQPQFISYITKQEFGVPPITEHLPLPVKQSPSQVVQMPCQSCQQSFSVKQAQNVDQQQIAGILLQEQSLWTRNDHEAACSASAAPALLATPQTADQEECDWSEHTCPDGFKYYYNCVTCESRWDEPEELALFQQRIERQQKLQNLNQQPCSLSKIEVDQTQQDMDQVQKQPETNPVVDPTCV